MYVLGVWDGHDAGAALICKNKILAAVNEERYTKRKLEVGFPFLSIEACLKIAKIRPEEIGVVAASTSDIAKTLTRVFPQVKEDYYQFRRRKTRPMFQHLKRAFKYKMTEFGPNAMSHRISESYFKKRLAAIGISNYKLKIYNHHECHAASAFFSGMKKATVVTLDGVGDGLSGSVSIFQNNELKRLSAISSRDSLGVFFEQVTNLMGMRELEDEGKVMALSNYAYPVKDKDNKMLDFFSVHGINIKAKYSVAKQYKILKNMLWSVQREQFAYMAQKTLETNVQKLATNAMDHTGIKDIILSGGVMSNIKANMLVRKQSKKWFVFPHMGDGGLALEAAMLANREFHNVNNYNHNNIYFGDEFTDEQVEKALRKNNMKYSIQKDISGQSAELLNKGNIVLWFQGRTEFGPRALGNRSILAPSYNPGIKDTLNIMVKNRDWFQPFCPSMLLDDAPRLFSDYDNIPDHYMTMGYMVKNSALPKMSNVINVDNSARPQMVGDENPRYRSLLAGIKKKQGVGVVLNTSFNIHGYPICNTPDDAVQSFITTKCKYLAINDFLVQQ